MSRILWAASISPIGHWISSSQISLRLPLVNHRIAVPPPASIDGQGTISIFNPPASTSLLCFQRRDRLPIRTRWMACKGLRALEKQRRWLVEIGNPLKAFGRGGKLADPPMRKTLGIGRGRERLLRRLLRGLREQFVNLYRGGASLHPDGATLPPDKFPSRHRTPP